MKDKNQNHIVEPNKKVSSVYYLISQLQKSKYWQRVLNEVSQMSSVKIDIIEQAKAMEKQQIIDAYHINPLESKWKNIGIDYYNETFKTE